MAGVTEVSVKLAHHFYIFLSATKTPRMFDFRAGAGAHLILGECKGYHFSSCSLLSNQDVIQPINLTLSRQWKYTHSKPPQRKTILIFFYSASFLNKQYAQYLKASVAVDKVGMSMNISFVGYSGSSLHCRCWMLTCIYLFFLPFFISVFLMQILCGIYCFKAILSWSMEMSHSRMRFAYALTKQNQLLQDCYQQWILGYKI